MTKHEPAEEIPVGQPNNEQRYWKNVTQLEITTRETNPDQDIKSAPGTKDRQLRTERYDLLPELEGSLIGTLSTSKTRELYDRYAQTVGDVAARWPTEEQLAKRLKLKLEHKIHVGSFEEEIAQLLIRYSSKAEMKHRKRNLQNYWTFPPEMMEAVHEAMGARTEVFTSLLNLGAYQFSPEYAAEDHPLQSDEKDHTCNKDGGTGPRGWRKFCPNALRTHNIFTEALRRRAATDSSLQQMENTLLAMKDTIEAAYAANTTNLASLKEKLTNRPDAPICTKCKKPRGSLPRSAHV
ncbi:hypothetical protein CYMTET_18761 [Cymbomonas tetramitiformis]|uniref:Uncharacterized protein n=1 Tax=Cymbomonas tetramitiformis TaxID=36881 RepID=A0AAE0G7Y2_9CHLO|nr:hypothetical protein CYMTET_18761 [Cymbomonas tetramitiformis]